MLSANEYSLNAQIVTSIPHIWSHIDPQESVYVSGERGGVSFLPAPVSRFTPENATSAVRNICVCICSPADIHVYNVTR